MSQLGSLERLGNSAAARLEALKDYLSDVRSDANRQGEYAPDYYRFALSLDGLSTTIDLDFNSSLAGILELSGGFDLKLFAEGSIGFAFDANAPDLSSTFLLDTAAGVSRNLGDQMPADMALLLGVNAGGSPELVVGATLESSQPLHGRLGFLELEAGSADQNVLGVGSTREGDTPGPEAIAAADDPFLSGALLLGLDLRGPGDGPVPLANIGQLTIDPLARLGFEIDPMITASLGNVISIDGEMLFGGYGELGSSGFSFSTTPFVFRPGYINLNLGEELVAASGPFVKISQFLNEYFLDPLEPLVHLLETEFSIAGLNLIGDGKLHNLIDIGVENTPNGAVTQWVSLYHGINDVVDAVARLQDSEQISIPSWLFLPNELQTIVAGTPFSGPDLDIFRTQSIDNELRDGSPSAGTPQGILQDAINTLTGALGTGGPVGLHSNDFNAPDIGRTEVTFPSSTSPTPRRGW